MARKKTHYGRITGHGTSGWPRNPYVVLNGEIVDPADDGRPITLRMTEDDARRWAAGLIKMADHIRERRGGAAEPEPEPEGDKDETPTECQSEGCRRVRPRWTMVRRLSASGFQWVCDPQRAMHCGVCCQPGESLTHYTEEEHRHSEEGKNDER